MENQKHWSTSPPHGKRRSLNSNRVSRTKRDTPPWLDAILNGIGHLRSFLVLVTNPSASASDRRHIDEQLAQQAEMQSIIVEKTYGKELSALTDQVGIAPYTFSEVIRFYGGSDAQLAQSWEKEGMNTLLQYPIFPPTSEDDRRMAVLYGVGNQEDLEHLESAFLQYFEPTYYTNCFSYAPTSQAARSRIQGISCNGSFFQKKQHGRSELIPIPRTSKISWTHWKTEPTF